MTDKRTIRSYVLRQGRMTAAQRNSLARHWTAYGVEPQEGFTPGTIFDRAAPLTVEIGFGMGDSLVAMASRDPERNFLGIEVHRPGVGHLLMGIHENKLRNLRVVNEDAMSVLQQYFPAGSVNRLQVFFPDPWPKKKHFKRRLIDSAFLQLTAKILEPGGVIHLATDWAQYAGEIVELLEDHEDFRKVSPPDRVVTKYEARGVSLGHEVFEMAYQRV